MTRIGVVGAGRVGAVLGAALSRAGHQVVAASGGSDASRARIAELLPRTPQLDPAEVARSCDVLLVCVPDDALDDLLARLVGAAALRTGQVVLHTSGRHGLTALEPAREAGARTIAMHPAMTFTGTEADLPRLHGCVFGVTAEPGERGLADSLVRDLGGVAMYVPEARRTLYHAALAHGANHLVTLVAQARELLATAGVADPSAALRPLLVAALDNALEAGDAALTGPIVRGDLNTVAAHLDDIALYRPATLPTYVALARATAERAAGDGRLRPVQRDRLLAMLDSALQGSLASAAEQPGVGAR